MTGPDQPRITRGPVSAMLDNIPDQAMRAAAKTEAHVLALEGKALTVYIDGVEATFQQPERLPNGILEVIVNMPDLPDDANPFLFVNPPILVPDGPNAFREDAEAAFRIMLADAIRGVLRRVEDN